MPSCLKCSLLFALMAVWGWVEDGKLPNQNTQTVMVGASSNDIRLREQVSKLPFQ
jgi:hypothetical protein